MGSSFPAFSRDPPGHAGGPPARGGQIRSDFGWIKAGDGSLTPVQISIRPLARNGLDRATIGMAVTDLTAARRGQEQLRALSQRLVEVQETERRHVAVELHEDLSQLTYAILMRCDSLARKLPAWGAHFPGRVAEAPRPAGRATQNLRRIAQGLRPSALDDLGLLPRRACPANKSGSRAHVQLNLEDVHRVARLLAPSVQTTLASSRRS